MNRIIPTPKSENYQYRIEELLDDMENPINDLENIRRCDDLTTSEKKLIENWINRIKSITNEIKKWSKMYNFDED